MPAFDAKAFAKAKYEHRTEAVPITEPELIQYFADGEAHEFLVRGLSGKELAQCRDSAQSRANVELLIDAVLKPEQAQELRKITGNSKEHTADTALRIEALMIVFPDFQIATVNALFDRFPTVFYSLTNKILELTGQGKVEVKPMPCGNTQESAPV